MKTFGSAPKSAAVAGPLFVLPFFVLNAIVAERVEPFLLLIRPGVYTNPFENVLLLVVLLLLPAGAYIAVRLLLRKGADG